MAMARGKMPTGTGTPTLLVAVLIGVTAPEVRSQ
jgi:hypothetical protein